MIEFTERVQSVGGHTRRGTLCLASGRAGGSKQPGETMSKRPAATELHQLVFAGEYERPCHEKSRAQQPHETSRIIIRDPVRK